LGRQEQPYPQLSVGESGVGSGFYGVWNLHAVLVPLILRKVVLRAPRHTVFIRSVEHLRRHVKISVGEGRRRGRGPVERRRAPRVRPGRLAALDAPEEIDDEEQLEE